MKSTPDEDVSSLPLAALRARADRACLSLREAHAHIANQGPWRSASRGMRAIAQALEAVERLLPGFSAPPRALLARTVSDLTPRERRVLREAVDAERAARERLVRLLGKVAPADVEDALARAEARERVTAELSALFLLVDRVRAAPAARASQS
jgi:hypothetical protein